MVKRFYYLFYKILDVLQRKVTDLRGRHNKVGRYWTKLGRNLSTTISKE